MAFNAFGRFRMIFTMSTLTRSIRIVFSWVNDETAIAAK